MVKRKRGSGRKNGTTKTEKIVDASHDGNASVDGPSSEEPTPKRSARRATSSSEATGSIGGRVTRRRKATVARNVTPPPAPNFEPSDEASTAEKENDREANGRPHHKGRPRRRAAKAAVAVAAALAAEEEAIRSEAEAAAAADAAAAAEAEPPLPTSPVRTKSQQQDAGFFSPPRKPSSAERRRRRKKKKKKRRVIRATSNVFDLDSRSSSEDELIAASPLPPRLERGVGGVLGLPHLRHLQGMETLSKSPLKRASQVAEAISNIGPAISQTVIPQVVDDDHPDAVHNDHDDDHHHAHAGVDPLNLSSAANHTRRRRRQATRRSLDTKLMSPPRVVPSRRSNHSSDAAAAAAAAATTGGRTDASRKKGSTVGSDERRAYNIKPDTPPKAVPIQPSSSPAPKINTDISKAPFEPFWSPIKRRSKPRTLDMTGEDATGATAETAATTAAVAAAAAAFTTPKGRLLAVAAAAASNAYTTPIQPLHVTAAVHATPASVGIAGEGMLSPSNYSDAETVDGAIKTPEGSSMFDAFGVVTPMSTIAGSSRNSRARYNNAVVPTEVGSPAAMTAKARVRSTKGAAKHQPLIGVDDVAFDLKKAEDPRQNENQLFLADFLDEDGEGTTAMPSAAGGSGEEGFATTGAGGFDHVEVV